MSTGRSKNGNTFLMACAIGIFVLIVAAMSSTVSMLLMQRNLQDKVDNSTLNAAQSLNSHDRLAQLNYLNVACRELVFDTRKTESRVTNEHPELTRLFNMLMSESRESADTLKAERLRIQCITLDELKAEVRQSNQPSAFQFLTWLREGSPIVGIIEGGYIEGTESNVSAQSADRDLNTFDLDSKYFDPKTNFYYGNQVLLAPAPDNDLEFVVSKIDPPTSGTVAPARLIAGQNFKELITIQPDGSIRRSSKFIPSSIRLNASASLTSSLVYHLEQNLAVSSTATTNGACQMP